MAEINSIPLKGKKNNTKCNKHSTRVDLTPMVDLGFLLITFFIFTTSLSQPMAMFLPMPDDKTDNNTLASDSKTLQLILESNSRIRYFHGNDSTHASFTDYSASGLRQVILDKIAAVGSKFHNPDETVVLIHPTNTARYGNLVDVLDEMKINKVKKYMLLPQ